MDKTIDIQRVLHKQAAFKRLIVNPDFQMIVHEMNKMAKSAVRAQLDCNPYTEQDKIAGYKALRTVLTVTIPDRIQSIINYQPEAPDKQVEPAKRFSFLTYFDQIRRKF